MFDEASGCYSPTWPADIDYEPRLSITKFGDGYEQRVLDGINWMDTRWKLSWPMRPRQIILDMDLYLSLQQGTAFPFYNLTKRRLVNVFCDTWTVSWSYKGQTDYFGNLDAEFRSANGQGILATGP